MVPQRQAPQVVPKVQEARTIMNLQIIDPLTGELAPGSWTGLILVGYGFKGLIPILYLGQTLEALLKSIVVVPEDVIINSLA